jgi:hypothetical protein
MRALPQWTYPVTGAPVMTPAERARQIDREEFAAESAAARARALAYSKRCREIEAAKYDAWLNDGTADAVRMRGMDPKHSRIGVEKGRRAQAASSKLYGAFGQRHTLSEWANEVGIPAGIISSRVSKGWSIERALTEPHGKAAQKQHQRNAEIIRRMIDGFHSARLRQPEAAL